MSKLKIDYKESLLNAQKCIAELEQKNTKLKTDYEVLSCSVGDFGELQDKLEEEQRKNNGVEEQLTKATELLKETQGYIENNDDELYDKIEQFLKEETK